MLILVLMPTWMLAWDEDPKYYTLAATVTTSNSVNTGEYDVQNSTVNTSNLYIYRYTIMHGCWCVETDQRPTFSELVDSLSSMLEGMAGYVQVSAFSRE